MRTKVHWAFRAVAVLVALMTTIQPMLGSFSFFRRADSIDYEIIHAEIGAGIYYLSMVLVVLSVFTRFHRRWVLLALSLIQVAATTGQLLLGVKSDTDASLLAYHIPLGVLIFLIAYITAGLSFGAGLDSKRA